MPDINIKPYGDTVMSSKHYPKNIVLCSDGTGQSGGVGCHTNVWRIFNAVDLQNHDVKQLTYYDDGVGTNKNMLIKGMGLAFGLGLSKNIRELYKYAVMCYQPGDQLYLFGFSRGSHTIRLLAELICNFGLLNPESFDNEQELDKAIFALQKKFKAAIRNAWIKNIFFGKPHQSEQAIRKKTEQSFDCETKNYQKNLEKIIKKQTVPTSKKENHTHIFCDIKIRFIGVWDTVSAVGMPIEEMRNSLLFAHHAFVDHKLHPNVQRACHALAIDEKRHTFKPELWNQSNDHDRKRIEQVWFSGVHANVGGGYDKDQLSLISLEWMINQASQCGLIFRQSKRKEITQCGDHNGTMYDSRSGFSAFYRYKPRNIQQLTDHFYPNKDNGPNIHISVYQRIMDSPASYSPLNLPDRTELKLTKPISIDCINQSTQFIQLNPLSIHHNHPSFYHENTQSPESNPLAIIWLQKVLHFCFMAFFAVFIYQGLDLTKQTPEIAITYTQPTLRGMQTILHTIIDVNPLYITQKILPGYANHWKIFAIMLLCFMVLMYLRHYLNRHHKNIANMMWNHAPFNDNRVNAKRLSLNIFSRLFFILGSFMTAQNALNEKYIPSFKIKVLPIIMTVFFLYMIMEVILYFIMPVK